MSRARLGLLLLVGVLALGGGSASAERATENEDYPPVYFYKGSSDLDDEGRERCGKVAQYLKSHPRLHVYLRGGTDPTGSVAVNRRIGRARGQSVKRALLRLGIPRSRITVRPPHLSTKNLTFEQMRFARYVKFLFAGDASVVAAVPATPPVPRVGASTSAPKATPTPATTATKPGATPPGRKVASVSLASSAPSPTPDKPKLEKIRLVFWRAPNHMLWAIAKTKGYFKEEGFDAQLVESQQDAIKIAVSVDNNWKLRGVYDVSGKKTLQKGIFAGAVCGYGFEETVRSKRPLVQIGTMINAAYSYVMKKELADAVRRDVKNFKGKTIGMAKYTVGGSRFGVDPLLESKLKQAGLKPGVDFKMQYYKDDNAYELVQDLLKGKIDAVAVLPPLDISVVRKYPQLAKVPISTFFPYMPCCRQMVPREALRKNREKYVRFERAVIKAERLLIERPNEAIGIMAKYLKLPPSVIKEIFAGSLSLASDPNLKGTKAMDRAFRGGKAGGVGEFVDRSVYEDALLSLIKEQPKNVVYKVLLRRHKRLN